MFQVLFVALCAAYLLLLPWTPTLPAALLKILPILTLVVRAAGRAPRGERFYLALGLLFSLAGDLILALSPETYFLLGVAAFLIAHVLYIVTFGRRLRYSNRSALLAAVVVAWCAAVGSVVFPHLGTLGAPVAAYMAVITTMGLAAAFSRGTGIALFAGAFSFIVSDSMLAIDRFVTQFDYAPYAVMITYYFGQFYIVEGVLRRAGSHQPEALCLGGSRP